MMIILTDQSSLLRVLVVFEKTSISFLVLLTSLSVFVNLFNFRQFTLLMDFLDKFLEVDLGFSPRMNKILLFIYSLSLFYIFRSLMVMLVSSFFFLTVDFMFQVMSRIFYKYFSQCFYRGMCLNLWAQSPIASFFQQLLCLFLVFYLGGYYLINQSISSSSMPLILRFFYMFQGVYLPVATLIRSSNVMSVILIQTPSS